MRAFITLLYRRTFPWKCVALVEQEPYNKEPYSGYFSARITSSNIMFLLDEVKPLPGSVVFLYEGEKLIGKAVIIDNED
jgi:hypothetical protein